MATRFTNLIRWLSAVMLMTISIAPPAVAHSHAGSSDPHTVRSAGAHHKHEHACHHDHGAGSATLGHVQHRHEPLPTSIVEADRSGRHLHFSVFGRELVLPFGNPPTDSDQSNPTDRVIVQLVEGDLIAPSPCLSLDLSIELLSMVSHPRFVPAAAFQLGCFSDTGRTESLLCDTARHERSGVQLI